MSEGLFRATVWRGGRGDLGVVSHSRTVMWAALKLAYGLMREYPQMRFANITRAGHVVRWWMRDRDGVWQPQ